MSKNIVFEGWLTKSPPSKRIWRTKWRRRWFALRQSGELPGQYFLDYYADRNCRRFKGTINLDLCEQVDAGLHMERSGSSLDPKLRGSVFTIQTQSRTYHLEADSETDMEKWVDAICSVCGLRATEDTSNMLVGTYQSMDEQYGAKDPPYILMADCFSGGRVQDTQAFTFDPKNIVISTRKPFERVSVRSMLYNSQQHIRCGNAEFSENDSNPSEDDCKSLDLPNQRDWSVTKTFKKLELRPKRNGVAEDGPPVPPRPPKTFKMPRQGLHKEPIYQGPKIQEPADLTENTSTQPQTPSRVAPAPCPSPARPSRRFTDDEDFSPPSSLQYTNIPSLPPIVDRALKPRHSSHSIGHINYFTGQPSLQVYADEIRSNALQYLDLGLQPLNPPSNKSKEAVDIFHGKCPSAVDADSAYGTVDFLKTEAFNITRKDAEASRSNHH